MFQTQTWFTARLANRARNMWRIQQSSNYLNWYLRRGGLLLIVGELVSHANNDVRAGAGVPAQAARQSMMSDASFMSRLCASMRSLAT